MIKMVKYADNGRMIYQITPEIKVRIPRIHINRIKWLCERKDVKHLIA